MDVVGSSGARVDFVEFVELSFAGRGCMRECWKCGVQGKRQGRWEFDKLRNEKKSDKMGEMTCVCVFFVESIESGLLWASGGVSASFVLLFGGISFRYF